MARFGREKRGIGLNEYERGRWTACFCTHLYEANPYSLIK